VPRIAIHQGEVPFITLGCSMPNFSSRIDTGSWMMCFLQRHLNIHHFVPCVVNQVMKLSLNILDSINQPRDSEVERMMLRRSADSADR
jgi:hypothetical protein